MLTLANHTHILFMQWDNDYPYTGWNIMGNLVSLLAHNFNEYPEEQPVKTTEAIRKLREKGFLTPDENGGDSYWIVEKAIPFTSRKDVWEGKKQPIEVIEELRI